MLDGEFDFGDSVFRQFMDLFVIPEIVRRQSECDAPVPYPLDRALVVFHSDGRKPEVRLNDEVKAQIKVKLSEAVSEPVKVGDPVLVEQIAGIERTRLVDADDQDCGHALIMLIGDRWHVSFDFVYNKSLSREHLRVASQFLEAAENACALKHWPVLVDTLCSASELTAKAYLLGTPDRSLIRSKSHGTVSSKTNLHGKLGNLDPRYVESFNRTWGLRHQARYLQGDLQLSDEGASELLGRMREFHLFVQGRLGDL
jgi:hypothetical protein